MANGPKREDGSNKTMGEMNADERREQIKASTKRIMDEGIGKHTAEHVARSLLR